MKAEKIAVDERVKEVFVAGPFFAVVNPQTGMMDDSERDKIASLIDYFESSGVKVHNAHRREAWGKEFLTADVVCQLDFAEIGSADLFVGFPGSPASPGTHVEIGWASALGKPTILLLEANKKYTFLVTGLPSIANVELLTYQDLDHLFQQLPGSIVRVMQRHHTRVVEPV